MPRRSGVDAAADPQTPRRARTRSHAALLAVARRFHKTVRVPSQTAQASQSRPPDPPVDTPLPARLSRAGRLWRAAVATAVIGALFWTSGWGDNDHFPLSPMTQFAFSVKSDGGEIHSHWLEADTVTGKRVRLPWDAVGAGLKRAEVEGQAERFRRDPSLLQGLARAQRKLRPHEAAYTRIYVVKEIKTLRGGRVVSARREDRAVWNVR